MELARRYSNFPDRLDDLVRVGAQLDKERGGDPTPDGSPVLSTGRRDPRRVKLTTRLTDADMRQLIERYHAGITIRELADQYTLGTTTVKRLLRDRKARRKDRPKDAA